MLQWRKFGNKQYLSCPFEFLGKAYSWTQYVGTIKQKNDGRWEFWLHPKGIHSRILSETTVQGVVATEAEAKAKVEANYA